MCMHPCMCGFILILWNTWGTIVNQPMICITTIQVSDSYLFIYFGVAVGLFWKCLQFYGICGFGMICNSSHHFSRFLRNYRCYCNKWYTSWVVEASNSLLQMAGSWFGYPDCLYLMRSSVNEGFPKRSFRLYDPNPLIVAKKLTVEKERQKSWKD